MVMVPNIDPGRQSFYVSFKVLLEDDPVGDVFLLAKSAISILTSDTSSLGCFGYCGIQYVVEVSFSLEHKSDIIDAMEALGNPG